MEDVASVLCPFCKTHLMVQFSRDFAICSKCKEVIYVFNEKDNDGADGVDSVSISDKDGLSSE